MLHQLAQIVDGETPRDGVGPARRGAGMALLQEPSKQPDSAARLGSHPELDLAAGDQRTPPSHRRTIPTGILMRDHEVKHGPDEMDRDEWPPRTRTRCP